MKRETVAVHGGYDTDPTTKAVAVPIYQTVAYEFDSADHGAALFDLEVEGYRYSRISNPTTEVLERRVAALEGGVDALCVSSGQAALNYAVLNVSSMGSNIVSVPQLYGTTYTLFAHLLPSQGIKVRFAESDQAEAIEKLIDDDTRAIFCESVGNPAGNVCDIEALAKVGARHGVPLIVDNTVATPILLRPIEYGADIVVHSLTKFMGGHGTTLGGAIVDSGRFPGPRTPQRFPMFNERDASYHGLIYTEHFGARAYIARCRSVYQRTTGAVLAPLSAFLLLQGIETVALRVERHVENARRVAEFLRQDRRVAWVNYTGFADNPYHQLAQKYLGGRACSLLTFGVVGGLETAKNFYDALKLFKRLVNMGDAKSLACHPGFDHAPADVGRRAEQGRRQAGDDPAQRRHRAHRRHHRRSRPGARRGAAAQKFAAALPPNNEHSRCRFCVDTSRSASANEIHASNCVTIGLINNMPDPALEATERQFVDLIRAAASKTIVRLLLFSIPEIPRADTTRQDMAERYRDVSELWDAQVDGLIVTGTEPRMKNLKDEPYWATLSQVVDWARDYTASTIWSCLAAHAAVLHVDGVERRPLADKLFGVFDCEPAASHPMTSDAKSGLRVPHSRYNDLPEAGVGGLRLPHSHPLGGRRRRHVRAAGQEFSPLPPGPSGIRGEDAAARISPRRRPLPAARARRLSGPAAELFRRQGDGDRGRVPRARAHRSPRASHRRFSVWRA